MKLSNQFDPSGGLRVPPFFYLNRTMDNNLPDDNSNGVPDVIEKWYLISVCIRASVIVWSAAILTMAYVGVTKSDTSFMASVFSGTLATFGVELANKRK